MSHLTSAEVTAGISRRALNTIKRGNHSVTTKVDISTSQTTKVGTDASAPGQPPVKTPVVETWCSSIDLININGFSFVIRQTQHLSDRADVTALHLNRIDLEALVRVCKQALEENGANA